MRTAYLVCYDITDDERLAKVYRTMRGFGEHVQYSVFLCRLSSAEKVMLVGKLTETINQKEDRILIADLGAAGRRMSRRIEIIGSQDSLPKEETAIVLRCERNSTVHYRLTARNSGSTLENEEPSAETRIIRPVTGKTSQPLELIVRTLFIAVSVVERPRLH